MESSESRLGFRVEVRGSDRVAGVRTTRESEVRCEVDAAALDPHLKEGIQTPYQFLNHMLETVAWRACLNVRVSVRLDGYKLSHVVCEDVGITLGEVVRVLWEERRGEGVNGAGHAYGLLDEALSRCTLSFEDRSGCYVERGSVRLAERVEDQLSADLVNFFTGFAQGNRCTLHLDLLKGEDPHHIWETLFRAFGEALRMVFQPNPWRRGTTPGVKGI